MMESLWDLKCLLLRLIMYVLLNIYINFSNYILRFTTPVVSKSNIIDYKHYRLPTGLFFGRAK